MNAVLYIAHGSRREAANHKFVSFIKKVMGQTNDPVQAFGFLEHAEPSVEKAIEDCIALGADKITVVPVFLLPGIHVSEDIPAIFRKYPGVSFRCSQPLGVDELIVDILQDRLKEAGFSNQENEVVLLVGHGSRGPAANIEFEKLAIKLNAYTGYLTTPVFYDEMVEKLSDKKVYLLPHLLFSGSYVTRMEKKLADYGERMVFCRPLGFDEKLIPLIEKRASEVLVNECELSGRVTA